MKEADRLEPCPDYLRPWQDHAACKGELSSWFYAPESERSGARSRRESRAKAVCVQCPVLKQCRAHALRVEEPWGIWGALTEEERVQINSQREVSTLR